MGDRFHAQRIDARNVASLGRMAARAQAMGAEEDAVHAADDLPGMTLHDGAARSLGGSRPAGAAARLAPSSNLDAGVGAGGDWGEVCPEMRYAVGHHPPAWPDLPAPDPSSTAPTPAWTRRLAAWLLEAQGGMQDSDAALSGAAARPASWP